MPDVAPIQTGPTRMLRVYAATQQKIAWLADLEGTTSAAIIEQLVADRLEERFQRAERTVQTIEKAKSDYVAAGN